MEYNCLHVPSAFFRICEVALAENVFSVIHHGDLPTYLPSLSN
jgi:hypothetical protein